MFDEDFKSVKKGELPKGWTGVASIGVGREGDKGWLQTRTVGMHEARTPLLPITGDFHVECEFHVPNAHGLRLALESEGSQDLVVALDRYNYLATLANAEPRKVAFDETPTNRLEIQREGDVYTLSVDGKEAVVHRIDKPGRYERLVVGMATTEVRVHRLTVRLARPAGSGAVRAPDAKKYFYQDFAKAEEGDLPKGWTGDTALGVVPDGSVGWLRASKDGKFKVKSPPLKIQGDFQLECRFHLANAHGLGIKLVGDNGKELPIALDRYNYLATLADAQPRKFSTMGDHISRLVLRRVGTRYTLSIDGEQVIVHRLEQADPFNAIEFEVNTTAVSLCDVGVRLLGEEVRKDP